MIGYGVEVAVHDDGRRPCPSAAASRPPRPVKEKSPVRSPSVSNARRYVCANCRKLAASHACSSPLMLQRAFFSCSASPDQRTSSRRTHSGTDVKGHRVLSRRPTPRRSHSTNGRSFPVDRVGQAARLQASPCSHPTPGERSHTAPSRTSAYQTASRSTSYERLALRPLHLSAMASLDRVVLAPRWGYMAPHAVHRGSRPSNH